MDTAAREGLGQRADRADAGCAVCITTCLGFARKLPLPEFVFVPVLPGRVAALTAKAVVAIDHLPVAGSSVPRWTVPQGLLPLTTLVFLAILALPPVLVIAGFTTWPRLAEVGQAYSTVGTLLAALALLGVIESLMLQRRANKVAQLFSARQAHIEIMKIAFDRPDFLRVPDVVAYDNLMLSYWAVLWDLNEISEAGLRSNALRLFSKESSREWWRASAGTWWTGTSPTMKLFISILSEECSRAEATANQSQQPTHE